MWHRSLKLISLALLVTCQAQAHSFRAHALWDVPDEDIRYPVKRVSFKDGRPLVDSLDLPPRLAKLFKLKYDQCMNDGGRWCDAPEGSCEHNTCGEGNKHCKPYRKRGSDVPDFGEQCARYALGQLSKY